MKTALYILTAASMLMPLACIRQKVRYEDPDTVTLLDNRFNDTDIKKFAAKMAQGIVDHLAKAGPEAKKPVVVVTRLDNRTD